MGMGALIAPQRGTCCPASPALQGAFAQAIQLASQGQSGPSAAGLGDEVRHLLTIFKRGHSSSSLSFWKIVSNFFDSTSKAAVSAKAFSLRRRSRSSSLMRRRSWAVCEGLAR